MAPRPAWGVSGLYDEGTLETIQFVMGTTVLWVERPMPGGPPPHDDAGDPGDANEADETQTGDS